MKHLLLTALIALPAHTQTVDVFGRPTDNSLFGVGVQRHSFPGTRQTRPDPVRWDLMNQPGGWIHSPDRDPVQHGLRRRSWIHTQSKDPVRYRQQSRSWVFGSIHDE